MELFENFKSADKKKVVSIWNAMPKQDRDHFINQVALGLSIWGSDEKGKAIISRIVSNMLADGSKNLSDFGLYLEFLDDDFLGSKSEKVKRAISVMESYRFRHDLPSEPNKDI